MPANLLLPAGPVDYRQRLEYLESDGPGGIQLQTMRVNEPWATEVLRTVKGWNSQLPVVWHISEDVSRRFGFADFDLEAYFDQISVADKLFEAGLDAIIQHCGLMKWIDDYDPNKSFQEQYASDFTCREILDQIERHIERFGKLVSRYGGKRVLIENCPQTLWRVLDPEHLVNFFGPQIGTPETVTYIANLVGCGNVLDTGHFNEFWSLVSRLYDFRKLPRGLLSDSDIDDPEDQNMEELCAIAGYCNYRGMIPDDDTLNDLLWHIRHCRYRLFHIDSCRGTWVDGKSDMERPVLTDEEAAAIHLDEIIRVAKANDDCLGMTVENVGFEAYPNLTPRPSDWEGKRRTFEFIKSKI